MRLLGWQQALLEAPCCLELALQSGRVAPVLGAQPAQLQAAVDEGQQHVAVEGLGDEVEGSLADRAHDLCIERADRARHEDAVDVGLHGAQCTE